MSPLRAHLVPTRAAPAGALPEPRLPQHALADPEVTTAAPVGQADLSLVRVALHTVDLAGDPSAFARCDKERVWCDWCQRIEERTPRLSLDPEKRNGRCLPEGHLHMRLDTGGAFGFCTEGCAIAFLNERGYTSWEPA